MQVIFLVGVEYFRGKCTHIIGLLKKGIQVTSHIPFDLFQYGHSDRKVPVRVFQWKQLENLYFRDKKFSIEVHDAKGRIVQTVSSQFNLYEDALKLEAGGDKTTKESASSEPTSASGSTTATAAPPNAEKKDELVDAIADSTTQVTKISVNS